MSTPRANRSRHTAARGQGMVEYGLVLALIAVIVIALLQIVGKSTFNALCAAGNGLSGGGVPLAWGDNTSGADGIGSSGGTIASYAQVQNLCGVTSVAAGVGFSFALKNDGTVWAWGDNSNSDLGTGSAVPATVSTPQLVPGFPSSVHCTSVAAGLYSGACVTSSGNVWTWGNGGGAGVLGTGAAVSGPGEVLAGSCGACGTYLSGITAISLSNQHMLALAKDGTVWSWGNNQDYTGVGGELGDGTTTNRNTPVHVLNAAGTAPLGGVTAVSASDDASLAILSDGTLMVWGSGRAGQLGQAPPCRRLLRPSARGPAGGHYGGDCVGRRDGPRATQRRHGVVLGVQPRHHIWNLEFRLRRVGAASLPCVGLLRDAWTSLHAYQYHRH